MLNGCLHMIAISVNGFLESNHCYEICFNKTHFKIVQ